MAEIRTRRWNDPAEAGDGLRILICRYRPRGVSKADETWDQWLPDLGPSKQLHAAVYGKNGSEGVPWAIYRSAYLKEMREQRELIASVAAKVSQGQTITLLCSSACDRAERCHRSLLKTLIEQKLADNTR